MPEIKEMALATLGEVSDPYALPQRDWEYAMQPLNSRLRAAWEAFIDSLVREWKTLNIVSVLLLSYVIFEYGVTLCIC
jgi:hypothetical protein